MKDASNNSGDKQQHRSKTSRQALQEALMARERFLEKHLHLRAYQAEIDRVLDKSGNCQGRMDVLGTLMQGKLIEMQKELFKLTTILQKSVPSN